MSDIHSDLHKAALRTLVTCLALLVLAIGAAAQQYDPSLYNGLHWRMIGPFRAGRLTVQTPGDPVLR